MGKRNHEQYKTQCGKLINCGLAASIIAMFGSLYFSEIKQYEPCALCWYQRIITYPFTIILGIAIIRKDYWISFYTMIVSAIGAFISTYHYFTKGFILSRPHPCMRKGSMYRTIYKRIGFITIPFLALTAFVIIFIELHRMDKIQGGCSLMKKMAIFLVIIVAPICPAGRFYKHEKRRKNKRKSIRQR